MSREIHACLNLSLATCPFNFFKKYPPRNFAVYLLGAKIHPYALNTLWKQKSHKAARAVKNMTPLCVQMSPNRIFMQINIKRTNSAYRRWLSHLSRSTPSPFLFLDWQDLPYKREHVLDHVPTSDESPERTSFWGHNQSLFCQSMCTGVTIF